MKSAWISCSTVECDLRDLARGGCRCDRVSSDDSRKALTKSGAFVSWWVGFEYLMWL